MRRLGAKLLRAVLALRCKKIVPLGKSDHAKPGLRHIAPHALLRRVFSAFGLAAALCCVGAVLTRLANSPGHQAQPARNGNDITVLRLSFLTIIIDPGSACSPPLLKSLIMQRA